MGRLARACAVVAVLSAWAVPAAAQPAELAAIQTALRRAVARAEPAVACVLVSRSDAYRQFQAGTGRNPGELGDFDRVSVDRALRFDDARRELLRRLDLADPASAPDYYGSGVVLDAAAGLVLTNYHVVRDATKVFVRLPGRRGGYADIHAADARSDLAVLRFVRPVAGLRAATLSHAPAPNKGDLVVVLANPYAAGFQDGSPSASFGIVSNVRRRAPGGRSDLDYNRTLHHYGTLIQTDARLALGSSGGALVNLDGELIGLTTSLAAVSGGETPGGYAVPLDANVRRVIEVLLRGEEVEYGFLGVTLSAEDQPDGPGVRVRQVTPGAPAALAGVRPGEVITAVNNTPIREFDDLFLTVGATLAGSRVTLRVAERDGRSRAAEAVLAKFPTAGPAIASRRPAPVRGLRVDYASVLLRGATRADELRPGVVVREVVADSPADRAGLRAGADLITHVNGQLVADPAQFAAAARRLGDAVWELTLAGPSPGDEPRRLSLPAR